MITDTEKYRNEIDNLPPIGDTRYENILKVGMCDKYYFYNIIKKISLPDNIMTSAYYEAHITAALPWTTLAHQIYGDQNLWWLICIINNIQNPTTNPVLGEKYKFINPKYVNTILSEIQRQLG
jgi:hypothetical protein